MRFIIILILLASSGLKAQSNYEVGSINSYNLNKTFNNNWILNLKGESRTLYVSGLFKENNPIKLDYQFTDIAFLASKKVGFNNWISGGFQLRFADTLEKRLTQQFNLLSEYHTFNLVHCITSDQTIRSNEAANFRIRYRLTYSKSLSGNKLDPKEWYVKIGSEFVNSFKANFYDLEFRSTPSLGYNFANANKIELAIDYRFHNFLNDFPTHQGFVVLNYFFSI